MAHTVKFYSSLWRLLSAGSQPCYSPSFAIQNQTTGAETYARANQLVYLCSNGAHYASGSVKAARGALQNTLLCLEE